MSRSKGKKLGSLRVRWKMPDGTYEELPLTDVEAARRRQSTAMAEMDHPDLRETGERNLRELDERLAKQQKSALQPKVAARAPRPKRRNPVREKIIRSLRKARRRSSFTDHLDAWLTDEHDRLLLKQTADGRYLVTDDQTGKEITYTRSTLEKLWNNAG